MSELNQVQRDDLRTIAAMIIPASDEYEVPGADDPAIQADMLKTLGRDTELVAKALDHLAPEIVQDEDSAIGLHLERGLVEPLAGIENQVEHLQRQLPSAEDHGASGADPTPVRQ